MGKFEIIQRKNSEYQFNLKASNGQVILTSEGYTTKANCHNGIESVRKNSQIDSHFDHKNSKDGKWYFTLKASNGQVIGTSETYESKTNCEQGAESVKKNAPEATVVDLTGK